MFPPTESDVKLQQGFSGLLKMLKLSTDAVRKPTAWQEGVAQNGGE